MTRPGVLQTRCSGWTIEDVRDASERRTQNPLWTSRDESAGVFFFVSVGEGCCWCALKSEPHRLRPALVKVKKGDHQVDIIKIMKRLTVRLSPKVVNTTGKAAVVTVVFGFPSHEHLGRRPRGGPRL